MSPGAPRLATVALTQPNLLARGRHQVATLEEGARRAVRNKTSTSKAVADLRRVSAHPIVLGVAPGPRGSGRLSRCSMSWAKKL